jgi:hypothetical protein
MRLIIITVIASRTNPMQSPLSRPAFASFTLDEIDRGTTRPGETAEQRAARTAAIRGMYDSYAPRDAMEDTMVAQIINLRLLQADAMRCQSQAPVPEKTMAEAQRIVATLTRLLLSCVRMLDQLRAREAKQRERAARAEAAEQPAPAAPQPAEAAFPARSPAGEPGQNRPASAPSRPNDATPPVRAPANGATPPASVPRAQPNAVASPPYVTAATAQRIPAHGGR